MGQALAEAAIALGHNVVIVSGPVLVAYPTAARVVPVVSTEDLLAACEREFPACDGVIGAAAPCDYRPVKVAEQKLKKTGDGLDLHLIETPDVMATLGHGKRSDQWLVGFALETDDQRFRALTKLEKKSCDLMVLNGPTAMDALDNSVEIIAPHGDVLAQLVGTKTVVAEGIMKIVQKRLIER